MYEGLVCYSKQFSVLSTIYAGEYFVIPIIDKDNPVESTRHNLFPYIPPNGPFFISVQFEDTNKENKWYFDLRDHYFAEEDDNDDTFTLSIHNQDLIFTYTGDLKRKILISAGPMVTAT